MTKHTSNSITWDDTWTSLHISHFQSDGITDAHFNVNIRAPATDTKSGLRWYYGRGKTLIEALEDCEKYIAIGKASSSWKPRETIELEKHTEDTDKLEDLF